MTEHPVKKYPTLGCCGLDCGLCPRYYTVGNSRCPGCCGPDFFNKHPSCSYITCCVKKKSLEVCAQCEEFPCPRFESWLGGGAKYDSFLTYLKVHSNMESIRKQGIREFIKQQKKRIEMLETMIEGFDDGRSRSFYCLAVTLLSIKDLKDSLGQAGQNIKKDSLEAEDRKAKAKMLRGLLNVSAAEKGIELKLRKKE